MAKSVGSVECFESLCARPLGHIEPLPDSVLFQKGIALALHRFDVVLPLFWLQDSGAMPLNFLYADFTFFVTIIILGLCCIKSDSNSIIGRVGLCLSLVTRVRQFPLLLLKELGEKWASFDTNDKLSELLLGLCHAKLFFHGRLVLKEPWTLGAVPEPHEGTPVLHLLHLIYAGHL